MKKFRWDTKYLYWGVTALCVVISFLLLYSVIHFWPSLKRRMAEIVGVLNPVIWGLVIAYLLNPIMRFFERRLFLPMTAKIVKNEEKRSAISRVAALTVSMLISIVVIITLLWLVLPQVYSSLLSIMVAAPEYVRKVSAWIANYLKNSPELEATLVSTFGNLTEAIIGWLGSIMPQFQEFLTGISSGVITFLKAVANVLIGFVFSSYILANKETFGAQFRKILYSIFSEDSVASILRAIEFADSAFTGFITGKMLDSLIIGIICYISLTIMRMPYVALISVVIGITNIIPFFGPFIGAIPSAIIILMVSPLKCLIFIVFILVLQQVDGNVIGPRILSNTVGLNGFWIMFAIIVGSGFFGFAGMLVGVPVFMLIYASVRFLVNRSLKERGLSTDTAWYAKSASHANTAHSGESGFGNESPDLGDSPDHD